MRAAVTVGLLLLLAACSGPPSQGPPELRLGIDVCDGCGMAISDARYAAASASSAGRERRILRFDDIGCLARWEASGDPPPQERWVHDRDSGAWVPTSRALFLRSSDWETPMGSGLAAFAEPGPSSFPSEAMRWDGVVQLARRGDLDRPLEPR